MYKAELTFIKTDDGRVRLEWTDDDPLSVFVTADTAEDALRLFAEHGDFGGSWLEAAEELSAPAEPNTLGLARKVAVGEDDIKVLIDGAAHDANEVRIDYVDALGQRTNERLILPRNTFNTRGYSGQEYVTAYDYKSGEIRSFRLDRIERAELVEV